MLLLLLLVFFSQTSLGFIFPKPLSPQDELLKKICAGDFELAEKHLACNKLSCKESRELDNAILDAKTQAQQSNLTWYEWIKFAAGSLFDVGSFMTFYTTWYEREMGASWHDNGQQALLVLGGLFLTIGVNQQHEAWSKAPTKQHYQKMLAIAKLRDDAAKR